MSGRRWIGRLVERRLLSAFGAADADEILRDLRELAADRGGVTGFFYYWIELAKYPVRAWWERRRGRGVSDRREGEGAGMDSVRRDVGYAIRSLARDPGFTLTTIAIIGCGIGVATAIASVVEGVLLEPLPVEDPDRLVALWLDPEGPGRARMTPGNFRDLSELEGVFTDVAAFQIRTSSLTGEGDPIPLRGGAVTPGYFETMGVQPVLGRGFRADEAGQGGSGVVVLGHHVWRQTFGGAPDIVGRTVRLDGLGFEVVGVAPPGVYPTHATVSAEIPFTASSQDFFVPLTYGPQGWANRRSHVLGSIGRLAPNVSLGQAASAVAGLGERLHAAGELRPQETFLVSQFREEVVGDVRFALLTLLGSVVLVLTIAVVNVGALCVVRTGDRVPEMAIRSALGASRARLHRQMGVENVIVVGASTALGLAISARALATMKSMVPYQIPRLAGVGLGVEALLVAGVLGAGVAIAFSLLGRRQLSAERLAGAAGRRIGTAGPGQRRMQAIVVAVQAGLGVVVLVGGSLLARSYAALRSVDTGFTAGGTWAMSIPADRGTLDEVVRSVRSLPGVAAAALAYDHPLSRSWGDSFLVDGVPPGPDDPAPSGSLRPFGVGYFDVAGIEFVEGRAPGEVDLAGPLGYAVVNESLRDTYLGDRSAVGARIVLPTAQRMLGTDGVFEVIGVVRDVRFLGPDQPAGPALYVPLTHFPVSAWTLLVRPDRADLDVPGAVRGVVRTVDPGLAVQGAQRLDDALSDLLARPRFNAMLLVAFGAMALVLCALGAYGLIAKVVVMRFKEIGIRLALGEDRGHLARSLLGSALRPLVAGSLIGVVAALALSRVVRSLLFEVSATDPVSFLASPLFVLFVGVIAGLVPTLHAVTIDPARTLRTE